MIRRVRTGTARRGCGLRAAFLLAGAVGLLAALAAPAQAAPRGFYGTVMWTAQPPSALQFTRLGNGGVGRFHASLDWPSIEPTKGVRNWSAYDSIVANAANAGVRVFPNLYGSPSWAASRTNHPPLGSSEARDAWRRFVKAAVRRYGPGGSFWTLHPTVPYTPIGVWELWNEESSSTFWYLHPSARSYARLLRITTRAIRRVDSHARIVLGGIFPTPHAPNAIWYKRYLNDLYAIAGIKRFFDGVALHPYSPTLSYLRSVVRTAHGIMANHGDGRTPIWITEFGWSSGGNPSPYRRSPAGQAQILKDAYRMLGRTRHRFHVRSAFWFTWRDRARQPGEPNWWGIHTGLFRTDGTAKPAWTAYAHVAGGTP